MPGRAPHKRNRGQIPQGVDVVTRTLMFKQFNLGRRIQMQEESAERPFWRYVAILDASTTDICHDLHGTIRPWDDPWWNTHTPPMHWGCRSVVVPISESTAKRRGVTPDRRLPAEEGHDGFGVVPDVIAPPEPPKPLDPEIERIAKRKERTPRPPNPQAKPKEVLSRPEAEGRIVDSYTGEVKRGKQKHLKEVALVAETALAGKSLEELGHLPLEPDDPGVERLMAYDYFRKTGNVEDNHGKSPQGLPQFTIEADGSVSTVNGRHRWEAARRLGMTHIVGRIRKFDANGDEEYAYIGPVRVAPDPSKRAAEPARAPARSNPRADPAKKPIAMRSANQEAPFSSAVGGDPDEVRRASELLSRLGADHLFRDRKIGALVVGATETGKKRGQHQLGEMEGMGGLYSDPFMSGGESFIKVSAGVENIPLAHVQGIYANRKASGLPEVGPLGTSHVVESPTIQDRDQVLIHEFGHAVHMDRGAPGWAEADAKIGAAFDDKKRVAVSQYGETNHMEYFAESYAAYMTRNAELKKHAPKAWKMVRAVLKIRGLPLTDIRGENG